jgi:hypothetical protein
MLKLRQFVLENDNCLCRYFTGVAFLRRGIGLSHGGLPSRALPEPPPLPDIQSDLLE